MRTWRLRLRPTAPFATPWHADTLFGALAWRCAEAFGEEVLVDWLGRFRARKPPFLLSDAFPGDLLPAFAGHVWQRKLEGKAKWPFWVLPEDFRTMCASPSFRNPSSLTSGEGSEHADRRHASLSRISDRTDDAGALFEVEQQVLKKGVETLSIYVRTESIETITTLFELLSLTGFGRKSSTGLGAFEFASDPEPCPEWMDSLPGANAFVSLSHFVPAPGDPIEGAWRTHVTYPKFHGSSVMGPFKGRLIQFAPGSWFRTDGSPRFWYGSAIDLRSQEYPEAMQYGFGFAVPMVV